MTTSKLQGVIAAIATAVDDKGEPDCARSTARARFLLANGCDGLNVLVMPAFHSASISTKMLQELGGAMVVGPLIVGLDKPVQLVSLGAKDADLVNMAALAAFNIGG